MDTKALRQKILDLAIRGKLVPQDPKDEPAAVLLERIRAEKMQMVKDGKLKPKDIKNDTIIYKGDDNLHYEKFSDGTVKCIEDEIPFEVPEGWAWCRLLPLTIKIGAGSTPTGGAAVYSTSGIKFIRSQNVYDDGLVLTDVAYISEEINQKKSGSIVKPKDILLNITGGSIGRCALVPDDFDIANVNQHVIIIRLVNPELRKYLHDVITSPYIQEQILSRQVGSGRGGLSAETLSTFLIPLPPMNEQVSIIKKLQDCISYTLTIADAQRSVSDLVSATKSKILDLAIRGKLVPQDQNDEPASMLLERIRSEKEELIKQGKIKRDKKESVIFKGDDNSYYEKYGEKLPSGWVVTNFETLLLYEQPTNYIVKNTNYKTEYKTPVLTAGKSFILGYTNEKENIFSELPVIIFDDFTTESKFVDFQFKVKSSAMKILHINTNLVLPKFAFYLMQATQIDHDNHQRYWISTYSQELLGLPPINEQKRILSALEFYISLLEMIS